VARAEASDLDSLAGLPHDAVLVIGDAALMLAAQDRYPVRVDLGAEWKAWTGLPFVFAVWAARREARPAPVQEVHRSLLASRTWGLAHLDELAHDAAARTGVAESVCRAYLGDLDYALSYRHLAGLTDFFRRLAQDGLVPDGSLSFISAA
jgi:chorismate dehydratase